MNTFDFDKAASILPEAERRIISGSAVKTLREGEKITLRVLPGWDTPQVWYRAYFRHYMFGLESLTIGRVRRPFLCLQRCFDEPCFFCDLGEALCSSSSEEDQALGDKIFPWSACLVNAYRVHAEEPEVEVYSLSNTTMKNLVSIWKEGVNFMDPVNGCPIIFKPVPGTKFFMPEADLQRKGPVPETFLSHLHNLNEVLERLKVSYLQIAANFSPSVVRAVLAYYKRRGVKPPEGLESLAGDAAAAAPSASVSAPAQPTSAPSSFNFGSSEISDLGFGQESTPSPETFTSDTPDTTIPASAEAQQQPSEGQVAPPEPQPEHVSADSAPFDSGVVSTPPDSQSVASSEGKTSEEHSLLDEQMAEIEKALGEIL